MKFDAQRTIFTVFFPFVFLFLGHSVTGAEEKDPRRVNDKRPTCLESLVENARNALEDKSTFYHPRSATMTGWTLRQRTEAAVAEIQKQFGASSSDIIGLIRRLTRVIPAQPYDPLFDSDRSVCTLSYADTVYRFMNHLTRPSVNNFDFEAVLGVIKESPTVVMADLLRSLAIIYNHNLISHQFALALTMMESLPAPSPQQPE